MIDERHQPTLFCEDINDAIRDVVRALGGAKKVGGLLWPERESGAQDLLNACLNKERREKLSIEQLLLLIKLGKEQNVHSIINFISGDCGYERPAVIKHEDKVAALQQAYIDSVKAQKAILESMERMLQPVLKAVS